MSLFSERLKNLRLEKGLKQSDIASKIDVSVQSYSAYENGREPNYTILNKLADLLEVDVAYLTGHSECKYQKNIDITERLGISEKSIQALETVKDYSAGSLTGAKIIDLILSSKGIQSFVFTVLAFYEKRESLIDIDYVSEQELIKSIKSNLPKNITVLGAMKSSNMFFLEAKNIWESMFNVIVGRYEEETLKNNKHFLTYMAESIISAAELHGLNPINLCNDVLASTSESIKPESSDNVDD